MLPVASLPAVWLQLLTNLEGGPLRRERASAIPYTTLCLMISCLRSATVEAGSEAKNGGSYVFFFMNI